MKPVTTPPPVQPVRHQLDRPQLMALAIRGESLPAGAGRVRHALAARITGGVFVAGPPERRFDLVVLRAGDAPAPIRLACLPGPDGAVVRLWVVREAEGAAPVPVPTRVEQDPRRTVLICHDPAPGVAPVELPSLVADVRWQAP